MAFEIKVPPAGESVTEAIIAEWTKKEGDIVKRDEVVVVLETDKASMEVVAENGGKLSIKVKAGETVKVGQVIAVLEEVSAADVSANSAAPVTPNASAAGASPVGHQSAATSNASAAPAATTGQAHPDLRQPSPSAQRVAGQAGVSLDGVEGSGRGGRITKEDAVHAVQNKNQNSNQPAQTQAASHKTAHAEAKAPSAQATPAVPAGETERVPMTMIRRRIAERLVEAQQTAALLTTFNEIDMSALMALRNQYKDAFEKRHGVKLGFMGIFAKACVEALKEFPAVNASIDGTDILYHHFYNLGVAVSTPKGLMVPVIRNIDQMSVAQIEKAIGEMATRARDGKISVNDLNGGTFSITNGGVFGSLMSTPILNPPQSAILGMHKIEDRPVVVNKEIVIRPMMYVALSYDHRMIDGRESVSFLVRVKQMIEDPQRLVLEV